MDDTSGTARAADDVGVDARRTPPGMPRWAKVFGIIAAVVVVLLVVLLLTGDSHGPGRHFDGADERAPGVEHSVPHP